MARFFADLLCTMISCIKVLAILVMFGLCIWITQALLGFPQSVSFRLVVDEWNIELWTGLGLFLGLLALKPTKIVIDDLGNLLESWQLRLKQWSRPNKSRFSRS